MFASREGAYILTKGFECCVCKAFLRVGMNHQSAIITMTQILYNPPEREKKQKETLSLPRDFWWLAEEEGCYIQYIKE